MLRLIKQERLKLAVKYIRIELNSGEKIQTSVLPHILYWK